MGLVAGNPLVGGDVLRRDAVQSPNYEPGSSGWSINQDGSAEFNDLTVRGEFDGSDYIADSDGLFFYSS